MKFLMNIENDLEVGNYRTALLFLVRVLTAEVYRFLRKSVVFHTYFQICYLSTLTSGIDNFRQSGSTSCCHADSLPIISTKIV